MRPRSFLVPDGVNVLKAPNAFNPYKSLTPSIRIACKHEGGEMLSSMKHLPIGKFHSIFLDLLREASMSKRILRKAFLISLLTGVFCAGFAADALFPVLQKEHQTLTTTASEYVQQGKYLLSPARLEKKFSEISLDFFRIK